MRRSQSTSQWFITKWSSLAGLRPLRYCVAMVILAPSSWGRGVDCKILPQVHKATLFKVVKDPTCLVVLLIRFILIFKCKDRTWMEMNCHILRIAIVFVPLVLQYAWPAASVPIGQKHWCHVCGVFVERWICSFCHWENAVILQPAHSAVVPHCSISPRPHRPELQKIRGGLWTIDIDMTIRGSLCLQAAHTRPCSLAIM